MANTVAAQSYQQGEADVFVYTVPINQFSPGTTVSVSDYLPFALQLCGVTNIPQVLAVANEMGVRGEDLQILESSDIEALLPQSKFQQRKFQSICDFIKEGGTLKHGMTMSDIYQKTSVEETGKTSNETGISTFQGNDQNYGTSQASSAQPTSFAQALDSNVNTTTTTNTYEVNTSSTIPTNNATANSQEDTTTSGSSGDCAWTSPLTMAGNGMTNIQQQVQQLQALKRQFTQLVKLVKSCNG